MCVWRSTLQLLNFGFIIVWWSTRVFCTRLKSHFVRVIERESNRFTHMALLILIHSIWYFCSLFFIFFFCLVTNTLFNLYLCICRFIFILIILPSLFTQFRWNEYAWHSIQYVNPFATHTEKKTQMSRASLFFSFCLLFGGSMLVMKISYSNFFLYVCV